MENLSFQTPAFAGVGVLGGKVGFACAWDVEASIDEGVEHAATVSD
jgi:hypothetical protein